MISTYSTKYLIGGLGLISATPAIYFSIPKSNSNSIDSKEKTKFKADYDDCIALRSKPQEYRNCVQKLNKIYEEKLALQIKNLDETLEKKCVWNNDKPEQYLQCVENFMRAYKSEEE